MEACAKCKRSDKMSKLFVKDCDLCSDREPGYYPFISRYVDVD